MSDGKRRLPVLSGGPSAPPAEPPEEERPPWHWAAIGVVGIFVFWLPLSMIAGRFVAEAGPRVQMIVHAAAYALACFAAGLIVGRFGGRAGRREAAIAGAAAALLATLLVASAGSSAHLWLLLALLLVVLALLGGGAAWAGAALGVRARPPTPSA